MEIAVLDGWSPGTRRADRAIAERAAAVLQAGGLVGLPTETVYGLAADAQDAAAVARIFAVKGRPIHHPLIVHVAGAHALAAWSSGPNALADCLANALWPGPLTIVVRRSARAGDWVTGGQSTVALRCPDHPIALACISALARRCDDPARAVAAPSANRFGAVSPTSAADVIAELSGWLEPERDIVIDGGAAGVGVESTIVDCTGPLLRILRPGAIGATQLYEVLAEAGVRPTGGLFRSDVKDWSPAPDPGGGGRAAEPDPGTGLSVESGRGAGAADPGPDLGGPSEEGEPRVPGMLASHYAPSARVLLTSDPSGELGLPSGQRVGLVAPQPIVTPFGWVRLAAPGSDATYARHLYGALRAADVLGLDLVVAVPPDPETGPLAAAVADRLRRASHEHGLGPAAAPVPEGAVPADVGSGAGAEGTPLGGSRGVATSSEDKGSA